MDEKDVFAVAVKEKRVLKKADIVLIAVLLSVSLLCLVLGKLPSGGSYVSVREDGREIMRLPLDEDRTERIQTPEGYNVLVIENGHAYIREADCPDKKCVHMKKISKNGECIVCLPHRLIIETLSDEQKEIDTVTK